MQTERQRVWSSFVICLAFIFYACKRPEQAKDLTDSNERQSDASDLFGGSLGKRKQEVSEIPLPPKVSDVAADPTFPFERLLTDANGRKIHAKILGKMEGKIAMLRLLDKKRFILPLEKLSEEDQEFFQQVPEGKHMLVSSEEIIPTANKEWERRADWLNDFDQAKKNSEKNKLKVFMLFTGTSWCPSCKKLEKMVLQTDEFKALASEHLNLVKYDYPRRNKKESEKDEIAKQFNVSVYPTVIITDADGNILRRMEGLQSENLEDYIQDLEAFLTKGGNYLIPSE